MSQIEIGHHIFDHVNPAALPRKIIFRTLLIDTSAGLNIVYKNLDGPIERDIEEFIDSISGYPVEFDALGSGFLDSPLDIVNDDDVWLVFYLSGSVNWQFSTKPGINTGFSTKANYNGKYANLTHVLRGGVRVKGPLNDANCRLLYLRAKCNKQHFKDGFNLHVDLLLPNNQSTTLIIDPTVRYP